ncbi:MAG: poly-gamma-glutamate biosynthesis protein PgsC/CapC [Nannocystaceae bacterium]
MHPLIAAIEVLPPGGLDHSILLAVLVGVWIALFFTETLGWVFVGLVVPGYLASVLVIQPVTAAVVVVEAVVTYLLARALAQGMARTGAWTTFFGRDRFFLIVILSVLVRQHDQVWVMPALARFLDQNFAIELPPLREFYSVGLVLVPLTANMLWKPGLRRGLGQIAVVVGLTYLVLTRVLLTLTNLSLGSFELLYEDTAIDFLGNAKVYMVLLTTAALAARYNLRYGWDFGGILVPALLGLLWLTPHELATTLAEACVIWAFARLLLTRTPLARRNLEGPRKVALVLTLGIALKWLLSLAIGDRIPGLRARDLYGFGYLLSTLLALRMLSRGSPRRVLLPALTTAGLGWLLGSVIGFSLALAVPDEAPRPAEGPVLQSRRLLGSELGVLALARVHAELAPPDPELAPPPVVSARRAAAAAIGRWLEAPTPGNREAAALAAAQTEWVLQDMPEETWSMGHASVAMVPAEREGSGSGLPAALLIPGAPGPVIAVPRPLAEAPAAEAALALCRALACRAVVIAGRDGAPALGGDPMDDALARLAPRFTLVLRGDLAVDEGRPLLAASPRGARELDVDALEPIVGAPERVPARSEGPMVLRVHPRSLAALLLAEAPQPRRTPALLPWLAARVDAPRLRPLTAEVPPSWAELVFLERRVARPLRGDDPEGLASAARMAALIDHEVWLIDECGAAGACVGLSERWRVGPASWGLMVVAPAGAGPIVEVPRAVEELGAWRLGAELFAALGGRALVIAADTDLGHPFTGAQALHQAVSGDLEAPTTILQLRGRRDREGLDDDVIVVGLGRPTLFSAPLPPVLADMFASGALAGAPWILADASPALTALAGASNSPVRYTREFTRDATAVLWLPASRRRAYAVPDPCPELARIADLRLGLIAGEGEGGSTRASGCAAATIDEARALGSVDPRAVDAGAKTRIAAPGAGDGVQGADPRSAEASGRAGDEAPRRPSDETRLRPSDEAPRLRAIDPDEARDHDLRPRRPLDLLASPPGAPPVELGFDAALVRLEDYANTGNLHRLREVAAAPGLDLRAGLGRVSARGLLALCEADARGRCALIWLGPADPGRSADPGPEALPWRRTRTIVRGGGPR